jgi:hypothetical protein
VHICYRFSVPSLYVVLKATQTALVLFARQILQCNFRMPRFKIIDRIIYGFGFLVAIFPCVIIFLDSGGQSLR